MWQGGPAQPQPTPPYPLSPIPYPLSPIPYPLSPTPYPLSPIPYQGSFRDHKLPYRPSADQVLVDDAVEIGRRAVAIPGAVRVDDGDRARHADAQAVGLGAQHAAGRGLHGRVGESTLQVFPTGERVFARRALAADAKEHVPALAPDAELGQRDG